MLDKYELKLYILDHYVNTNTPMSIKEIANRFNIKESTLKSFMNYNNLNKKTCLKNRNNKILNDFFCGKSIATISEKYNVSSSTIYKILNNN